MSLIQKIKKLFKRKTVKVSNPAIGYWGTFDTTTGENHINGELYEDRKTGRLYISPKISDDYEPEEENYS